MIIIDHPHISDYLIQTIVRNQYEVIDTPPARELLAGHSVPFIAQSDAISRYHHHPLPRLYTSSENAIAWLETNLGFTKLAQDVLLFKDKAAFRNLTKSLFPDFFYQTFPLSQLDTLQPDQIPCPFIIKPNIGFFSLGVHCVNHPDDWPAIHAQIRQECDYIQSLYPAQVLNTGSFIVEQYITGDEYALDVYFNSHGQPVILNILHHPFSSDSDVSDRLYIANSDIILNNLNTFDSFLHDLGELVGLQNIPLHIEVRIDSHGILRPIEINPLRFGGWCTTGDFTGHCYGFNSYECFFNDTAPDWHALLADKTDYYYSLIVLNNSTGIPGRKINAFDYDALLSKLECPLHLTRVDFHKFPLFGFLFVKTHRNRYHEIDSLFHSNLCEFIH